MSYPRSVGAILAFDPREEPIRIRGKFELRGLSAEENRKILLTARVHGTPAGRDKGGHIKVSDDSMDVATPSPDGSYILSLEKQQLWLLEATAEGFETASVIVAGSATVDFVLVTRALQK